ncbi:hypothetical protein RND81_01G110900 [Saponaria officinalis]|uniref:Uncharacterized protein n=1 Tax=Saponaria officinalis TaxID=3572 RepID=A0AAW1NDQ6_SAPOF
MSFNFLDMLNSNNYTNCEDNQNPQNPNYQNNSTSHDKSNSQNNSNTQINLNYPNNLPSQNILNSRINPNYHYIPNCVNVSHHLIPQNSQNISSYPISLSQNSTPIFVQPTQPSPSSTTQDPKKTKKRVESNAWREVDDEALMSAWCLVGTNSIVGKNQYQNTRWTKVSELYEKCRLENPSEISHKSIDAMRARFSRLNELSNKWLSCVNAVRKRPRKSGTNEHDEEEEAQKLFAFDNNKKRFENVKFFNKIMSKHPKWSLNNNDVLQQETPNTNVDESLRVVYVDESFEGSFQPSNESSKRSRVEEDNSEENPETPESIRYRPEGREA